MTSFSIEYFDFNNFLRYYFANTLRDNNNVAQKIEKNWVNCAIYHQKGTNIDLKTRFNLKSSKRVLF